MKKCYKCKIIKDLDEFDNEIKSKDGKTRRCSACRRYYSLQNREQITRKQRERRARLKDIINYQKRELLKKEDPRKLLWKAAQNRAKRRHIEFSISLEDIILPKHCPLLEVEFERGSKGNYPKSYSLDRIDNSKGYVKDNIMVISAKANLMKSNALIEELLTFSKNILRLYSNDDIVRTSEKSEELENKESLG